MPFSLRAGNVRKAATALPKYDACNHDDAAMNKTRFEAFSDGVFGIAATLLVLGFTLPLLRDPNSNHDLTRALIGLWPNLLAYGLSFGVIGIMWQNHHALFRFVRRIDRTVTLLNLLLLAGTAFIPFATGVLGSHPTLAAATFLYGVTLTFCSTMYNLMLNRLVRTNAFGSTLSPANVARTVRAYRVGWLGYGAAMLLALVAPVVSFAAYLAIAAYYLIPHGVDADIEG
jgi:uncharacterized membrane protein